MKRTFWISAVEAALAERNVVWLSGVRRAGKTTLVQSLDGVRYHDCELLRVRRQLEDPELFFRAFRKQTIVLDEIHRLQNPAEVLKIAADHFPATHVVATGSSTLAAKKKFTDTLTGRKREVWLVPSIAADLIDFDATDLPERMLRGGLPPFLLRQPDDKDYEEWFDSYWAKDLSELFVVDKKSAFMKFVELLFAQSGGLFEAQSFTAPCEVSRPTIQQWLAILETTLLAVVVRPYFGGASNEIKSQPKVYAFDTGFVCYFRGWDSIRDDDKGLLLEHLVLGEILARHGARHVHHWRDKQKHEVDFVLEVGRTRRVLAIECKSSAAKFDPAGLLAFRRKHPHGENIVVTARATDAYRKRFGDVEVEFVPFFDLPKRL